MADKQEKGGRAKGCAVIISGKRDFKYFMLLKLAAKKKSPKIQQSERGTEKGRRVAVVMAANRECAHVHSHSHIHVGVLVRVHVQDKSSDQAGGGWRVCAGLAGNLSHFDFCSSVITS